MTKIYPEKTFPTLKMVVFKKKKKKKNVILLSGHSLKDFENLFNRGINILAKVLTKNIPLLPLHSSSSMLCLC